MLFAYLMTMKPGTTRQVATERRLAWEFPDGFRPVAEYWLETNDPQVVGFFEADAQEPMMMALSAWDDLYDIKVVPCVTVEQGLAFAHEQVEALAHAH